MNKSAIYAIVAVVVIIIIILAAVFALGLIPLGGTPSSSPSPSPTPSAAPGAQVADATSLTFSANITTNGQTTEYKWYGKNLHSTNETLRVDFANYVYILDAGQQQSWVSTDSGATYTAGVFNDDWVAWGPQWSTIVDNLAHWESGDTYTFDDATGAAYVVFNISINPTIPDSTFVVS